MNCIKSSAGLLMKKFTAKNNFLKLDLTESWTLQIQFNQICDKFNAWCSEACYWLNVC